jgi:hypothetical protein
VAETLSSLVDKLSVTNCKLYAVQDIVHAAARDGKGLEPEIVQKLTQLNLQRNKLGTELDELFARSIKQGWAEVAANTKVGA